MSIEVGSIVEGTVSGITNFGAFVTLPENKVGLIHISEVAESYVKDVHDFLKENDKVKVKVLNIDAKGKIGLSIKQLQEKKPEERTQPDPSPHPQQRSSGSSDFRRSGRSAGGNRSFDDMLSRFMKDSEERLTDLRRKTDSKRGGRGARRSG